MSVNDKNSRKPNEPEQQQMQIRENPASLSVQGTNEEITRLRKQVESLKSERQDIAVLGDGQVFIRRREDGSIKAVTGAITLSEKKGHICEIQGKFMITNEGYLSLNKVANVSLITPKMLILPNGSTMINPYPVLDEKLGYIKKVWVKKIAIGFSPIGNLVKTSATLLYDPFMYFIQDIIKKIKQNKSCGRICVESMLTDHEKKTGVYFPSIGGVGVWGNLEDMDFLKCFETFNQSTLFAERKAVTICERNALRKHPALSQGYVDARSKDGDRCVRVGVIGYMNDLTREDLERIAEEAEKGGSIKYKGDEVIVIESEAETASEADYIIEREDDEEKPEEQDMPVQDEQEVIQPPIDNAKNLQEITGKLQKAISIIGEDRAKAIAAENFDLPIEKLKPKQLEQLNKLISMELDKEAAL